MILPDFAKPIADAREKGRRPKHMILVSDGDFSLHKRFPENPVVRVRPEQKPGSLNWRFVADLDVEIVTNGDAQRIHSLVNAVKAARPYGLWVWHFRTGQRTRIIWLEREWYTNEWQEG